MPDGAKVARLTYVVVNPDDTVQNPSDPEHVVLGTDETTPCPPPSNTLDCFPADALWHSVGTVRAAADGTLWVGNGESTNASTNPQLSLRAQNDVSYAGKILHVDANGHGLPGHPFCPSDNDLTHTCTKVAAKGFRNPYRFTVRSGGGLVVGDVGWSSKEEIDLISPGKDYGWPCWEGTMFQTVGLAECDALQAQQPNPFTPPDYDYDTGTAAARSSPVRSTTATPRCRRTRSPPPTRLGLLRRLRAGHHQAAGAGRGRPDAPSPSPPR